MALEFFWRRRFFEFLGPWVFLKRAKKEPALESTLNKAVGREEYRVRKTRNCWDGGQTLTQILLSTLIGSLSEHLCDEKAFEKALCPWTGVKFTTDVVVLCFTVIGCFLYSVRRNGAHEKLLSGAADSLLKKCFQGPECDWRHNLIYFSSVSRSDSVTSSIT